MFFLGLRICKSDAELEGAVEWSQAKIDAHLPPLGTGDCDRSEYRHKESERPAVTVLESTPSDIGYMRAVYTQLGTRWTP
jgi:hypothetical protein